MKKNFYGFNIMAVLISGCCSLECIAPLRPVISDRDYWSKTDLLEENLKKDWMNCGGMANGGFNNNKSATGDSTEKILRESNIKRIEIANCMNEKGYYK